MVTVPQEAGPTRSSKGIPGFTRRSFDLDEVRTPRRRQPHDGQHIHQRLHDPDARRLLRRATGADAPGSELALFLKWEQLAAYARASVDGDLVFRGTERVQKALSESPRASISDDQPLATLPLTKVDARS